MCAHLPQLMKKLTIFILLLAGVIGLGSCSSRHDTDNSIEQISEALQSGDLNHAQSECDRVIRSTACLDSMSVEQLCRMAISMADLADRADDRRDENAAQAVLCYRTALQRDSVATTEYLRQLGTDDYRHVYMLNQLLRPITDREDGVIYTSDEDEAHWHEAYRNPSDSINN